MVMGMAKCTDCLHYNACSGYLPSDMDDEEVLQYMRNGTSEKIPFIEELCNNFDDRTKWAVVVRCKDCKHSGMYAFGDGSKGEILACLTIEEDGFVRFATGVDPEHFCSYGERKTDV